MTSILSEFLLSLDCSLDSILHWVLWLSRLPCQIALIFLWCSPPLCQQFPHLWPKPQIFLLDNYTGTFHRHFKFKIFKSLPHPYTHPLACYVLFTSKIYTEYVIHFYPFQDHPSSTYSLFSSGWAIVFMISLIPLLPLSHLAFTWQTGSSFEIRLGNNVCCSKLFSDFP